MNRSDDYKMTMIRQIMPTARFKSLKILSHSELETIQVGEELAQRLAGGTVIALFGNLGAGKTCLTRGICRGLGMKDLVSSPTFTLINEYHGRIPVFHFDFYRINSEKDLFSLGLDEYFEGDGICIIEWAERAQSFLPAQRIEIHLTPVSDLDSDSKRSLELQGIGFEI